VDIPNVSSLTDFSYLGWFKNVGANQDNASQILINTRNGMIRSLTTNMESIWAMKFGGRDGTCPAYGLDGESVANQDQWHHFAYTATEAGSKLYIDGVLIDETEESFSCQSNYSPSYIGWHGANQSSYFYGLIDEISIWSTALTQAQIQSYMTTSPTGNESGLVGYWNFNEGEGTTLTDQKGYNGYTGTFDLRLYFEECPEFIRRNCSGFRRSASDFFGDSNSRQLSGAWITEYRF